MTAYDTVEELLQNPEIEAVSVCTANVSHAELSIRALNAGKHVLCEKPMAVSLEECEAMVQAAARNGRRLMIGQNQRLAGAHVKAKELIDRGEIGRILSFQTSFGHSGPETWSVDTGKNVWFFDKQKAKLGAMGDLGIHKTDLIQFCMIQFHLIQFHLIQFLFGKPFESPSKALRALHRQAGHAG